MTEAVVVAVVVAAAAEDIVVRTSNRLSAAEGFAAHPTGL